VLNFWYKNEQDFTQSLNQDYKKMTTSKLLQTAVEKGLINKEKGSKLKKKDLIELFA
jgi:hypothetical protein